MRAETEAAHAAVEGSKRLPTVAAAIAAAITAAGVRRVFTFPGGGSNLPLLEALGDVGIALTLNRSEGGSAFMASSTADLTGLPSVFLVGLGPGAASAVNGSAHAYLDRSPVLVIADRYSAAEIDTSGHQLLDQAAMFAPVTKATVVARPDNASEVTCRALELCLEYPRGPVLLEVERDVARLPTNLTPPHVRPQLLARADAESVGQAAATISQAENPVLLVGLEARQASSRESLVELAERLSAPVFSTYKAKGVFPEDHPLSAGILTGAPIEGAVLSGADLLIAVGVDPVELLARPWLHSASVLALRPHALVDTHLSPRQTLTGPLVNTIEDVLAAVERPQSRWAASEVEAFAAEILDSLRVESDNGLSAWQAVEAVQSETGDAVVAVDAGAHMFAATWFWRSSSRGRFLISNGLASMGFAVPAAIAAALTSPDLPVVAFTGDGGFVLNAAELETAARLDAKVIVIVLNDASLSLIRIKNLEQRIRGVPLDYLRSDFAMLARGLGVRGATATTGDELSREVRSALVADETTVIDVVIDGSEYSELNRLIRGGL